MFKERGVWARDNYCGTFNRPCGVEPPSRYGRLATQLVVGPAGPLLLACSLRAEACYSRHPQAAGCKLVLAGRPSQAQGQRLLKYYHHHFGILPDGLSTEVARSDYLQKGVLVGRPLLVWLAFLQLSWADPERRGKTPQGEPTEPFRPNHRSAKPKQPDHSSLQL